MGAGVKDLAWIRPDGEEMDDEDWQQGFARSLGMFIAGDLFEEYDERGRRVRDTDMLLLMNSDHEAISFRLPAKPERTRWDVLLDTVYPRGPRPDHRKFHSHEVYPLQGRSLVLMVNASRPVPRTSNGIE
jgi:glycogen operon protein